MNFFGGFSEHISICHRLWGQPLISLSWSHQIDTNLIIHQQVNTSCSLIVFDFGMRDKDHRNVAIIKPCMTLLKLSHSYAALDCWQSDYHEQESELPSRLSRLLCHLISLDANGCTPENHKITGYHSVIDFGMSSISVRLINSWSLKDSQNIHSKEK